MNLTHLLSAARALHGNVNVFRVIDLGGMFRAEVLVTTTVGVGPDSRVVDFAEGDNAELACGKLADVLLEKLRTRAEAARQKSVKADNELSRFEDAFK